MYILGKLRNFMANKYDCFHSMEMFVEDVYVAVCISLDNSSVLSDRSRS